MVSNSTTTDRDGKTKEPASYPGQPDALLLHDSQDRTQAPQIVGILAGQGFQVRSGDYTDLTSPRASSTPVIWLVGSGWENWEHPNQPDLREPFRRLAAWAEPVFFAVLAKATRSTFPNRVANELVLQLPEGEIGEDDLAPLVSALGGKGRVRNDWGSGDLFFAQSDAALTQKVINHLAWEDTDDER